ncbi:MAG: class I tRNA ligase family protein [bacterium]|nr:class I tRNA ligase family protein [bacterium]
MKRYNPKEIEPKWQAKWAEDKIYETAEKPGKTKIFASPMLPYPSGAGLHTGHVRNYSISDAVARFNRQRGYNTLSTIAWDAFGLPAENYAIKTGTAPDLSTAKNIAYFKEQLQKLGMSFDWSREFNTSDPEYYRWTQWMFQLMFDRNLAYQAEKLQWWCDKCKTVLADEQVVGGKCWRHESPEDPLVTKKSLKQWFFKITDYADAILDATDELAWPEKIKTMQKNWIGRSKGALIKFSVSDSEDNVEVFTTRPDTIHGATFLVLAPEHPLTMQIAKNSQFDSVKKYVEQSIVKSDLERQENKEKTGVFTGSYAINPANGESVPIWIADYVLPGYGTGAIMAVPAHDERDNEFASTFDLPIRVVVEPTFGEPKGDESFKNSVYVIVRNPDTKKIIVLDWGPRQERYGGKMLIGGGVDEGETYESAARREILEETGYKNVKLVKEADFEGHGYFYSNVKNKNMEVSGKGLLFELIDEEKVESALEEGEKDKFSVMWEPENRVADILDDGVHAAFYRHLVLDELYTKEGRLVNSGDYSGTSSYLAREKIVADLAAKGFAEEKTNFKIRDWLISRQRYWGSPIPIIHCPDHGAVLVPEKDLPVLLPKVENYAPDGTNSSILAGVDEWVNVPCPTCGKPAKRETDTMDGYVCSTWYLHRYTDAHNPNIAFDPEKANYWFPIDYYFGGDHAVAHLLYIRFFQRVLVDAGIMDISTIEPIKRLVYNGYINADDGRKMSKSLGNTVDPMDIINQGYGADALRVFELFIAPYDQDTSWNTNGVPGAYRFLQRYWTLVYEFIDSKAEKQQLNNDNGEILKITHRTIKKVSSDLENLSFNTAVSAMMECVNDLYKVKAKIGYGNVEEWEFALKTLSQLLAPFAPHITEEVWHDLGAESSVHVDNWPVHDESYLTNDTMEIAIQVNGKLRGTINVASSSSKEEILQTAKNEENVAKYLSSQEVKKEIYVPNKLVNFVI